MSEILDQLREFTDALPRGPVPARLEVGKGVLTVLCAAIPAEEPRWTGPPPSALFGIPVVPSDDVPPGEWRLLDTDGAVIDSGTL